MAEITWLELNLIPISTQLNIDPNPKPNETDFDPTCTQTDSSELYPKFTQPKLQLIQNQTRPQFGSPEVNPNWTQIEFDQPKLNPNQNKIWVTRTLPDPNPNRVTRLPGLENIDTLVLGCRKTPKNLQKIFIIENQNLVWLNNIL